MATQPIGMFGLLRNSLRVIWKATRELFHEVVGALFFILAVSAINSAWRAWHRGAGQWLIGTGAAYAAVMIVFGVQSFRASRRVR